MLQQGDKKPIKQKLVGKPWEGASARSCV